MTPFPPSLLSLPLELRNQIWTHVLTAPYDRFELLKASSSPSPTTHYTIHPLTSDGGCPILLSFLRTNSQIYRETKALFWAQNTLYLSTLLSPPREGILTSLPSSITTNVRHVALPLDITFHKILDNRLLFLHNIKTLVSWVRNGHLSSITLVATSLSSASAGLTTRQFFEKMLQRREDPMHGLTYKAYLTGLLAGTYPTSPLATVKGRFVIDTGHLTPSDPSLCPQPLELDPMPLLRDIARAWGGRLEVNDVLAFQDGEEVNDMFLVQELEKEKKFFFREDVDLWLCAEILKEGEDDEEKVERIYGPGYLAGLGREERRAFCARYESKITELREVHKIRKILEERLEVDGV